MKRLLRLFLGVLFIVIPMDVALGQSVKVALPWRLFSEAVKEAVSTAGPICVGGVDTYAVRLMHTEGSRTDEYNYFIDLESGRIIFALWIDSRPGLPDALGFGTVDMKTSGASDTIPPLKWETYDPAKHGDSPCPYLIGPKKSST